MGNIPATTPSRVSDIAKAIYAAASGITGDDADVKQAQDEFTAAAEARNLGRVKIMIDLGNASNSGNWTEGEITLAVSQAIGMGNSPESKKALATFAADIKAAMHPNVRGKVRSIHALVDEVWSAEKEAGNDAPKPCKKAFQRFAHMFKGALVGTRDGTVILHGPSDVVFWAKQNDPDHDADKVRKKLDTMAADIAKIAANFPVSHFGSITEFLSEVSTEALKAARDGLLQAERDVTDSHKLGPVAPMNNTATFQPTPTPTTVVEEVFAVEDVVSDPVEDYLAELDA